MKRTLLAGILAAALVFAVGTTSAFAAEPYYRGCSGHYVSGVWVRCADVDGNGLCDTCGAAFRAGPGFIDEDGDGVCDHFTSGTRGCGYGGGAGRQRGYHGGRGR